MKYAFTENIEQILKQNFGKNAEQVFEKSFLIQYLNEKTRSANRGSKARGSFANLYAIYVIVEDYIAKGYAENGDYSTYEGALFGNLFARQRELLFGSKLQNHALNNRMNSEFQKYFPKSEYIPILRNLETNRYWVNENLLKITVGKKEFNIAKTIITIIDEYICTKQDAFQRFVKSCEDLQEISTESPVKVEEFIIGLLAPNVDARLFEIVSYSILKYYFHDQQIYWGFKLDKLNTENLTLYKTGRTNANDGGIDFVMKPLGRFFQVTETLDFKKYFLDIDKIQKYPISFIIKSEETAEDILRKIRENAEKTYSIKAIVEKYMDCIEEVINISTLIERFNETKANGYLDSVLDEIVLQSKVEFNYEEESESVYAEEKAKLQAEINTLTEKVKTLSGEVNEIYENRIAKRKERLEEIIAIEKINEDAKKFVEEKTQAVKTQTPAQTVKYELSPQQRRVGEVLKAAVDAFLGFFRKAGASQQNNTRSL
jgi:hypothetical protein